MILFRFMLCLSNPFHVYFQLSTAKFKYKTVSSFLADVELIYKNSLAFSGPDQDITKSAKKLLTDATQLLFLEKQTLGEEFDTFTVQENDVKMKYVTHLISKFDNFATVN
jgi:hypothetical protein